MICESCGTRVEAGRTCPSCGAAVAFYHGRSDAPSGAGARPASPPAAPPPATGGEGPAFRSERFEILRTLGMGGVGIVYLARERKSGQMFALKVLRPSLHRNAEVIARFRREVEVARKFDHPNIARVHELVEADGHIYIVMQYIEGLDLGEWQKRLNPSLEQKLVLLKAVASAVDAAHAGGVVHRDLKPGNIRVGRDGQPYILDFGVAAVDEGGDITRLGSFIGTPLYMSPEQAQGKRIDHRSDIYSLGAVFYELVAGRPPFIGDSGITIALKHIREAPFKPRGLNPSIPPVIEDVILQCLQKDPKLRPQRASAIVEAIEAPLKRELEAMRSAARAVAQEPHSGDLRDISLFQYLRVLVPIRRNLLLEIVNNDEFGRYHFRGAHLVHAEAGNLRDEEVAYNLFYWTRGIYRVVADAEPPPRETLSIPWIPFVEAYFARLRRLMMGAHAWVPGPIVLDLVDPRGASVYRYVSDEEFARRIGEKATLSLEAFTKGRSTLKDSTTPRVSRTTADCGILFCFVPGLRHYFYAATDARADLDALYGWITGELEQGMIESLHDCLRESDRKRLGSLLRAKVLLVENEDFLGNLVRIKLRSLGMEVYLVRDGSKAVEMAPQFVPDIIVLASEVPGYSGYDVCRVLARDPRLAKVPIVLLAPAQSREAIDDMRLPGVVRVVEKPIVLGELVDLVQRYAARGAQVGRIVPPRRPAPAGAQRD